MKKVLLSAIITISSLGFALAHNYEGSGSEITPKDNSDNFIIISKPSNTKKVEVLSPKLNDDNFKYVKEKRDLIGYALQMASFSDLTLAKEYALKIVQKGDAEKRQLFIYTINNPEKTYYKVYFGLLKTDESAREKQRKFLSLGYSPFVKEFR